MGNQKIAKPMPPMRIRLSPCYNSLSSPAVRITLKAHDTAKSAHEESKTFEAYSNRVAGTLLEESGTDASAFIDWKGDLIPHKKIRYTTIPLDEGYDKGAYYN